MFAAKYPGICINCGREFQSGQMIDKFPNGYGHNPAAEAMLDDFALVAEIEAAEQYEAFCADEYAAFMLAGDLHEYGMRLINGLHPDIYWSNEAARVEREQEEAAYAAMVD